MRGISIVAWILTLGLCLANQNPILDVLNYIDASKTEGCDVSGLSYTIAWCNDTLTKQNTLPEHTLCQSYRTEYDDIICIKHKWTKLKYAEKYSGRSRRSIIDVLVSINESCTFFCNSTALNESLLTHPPEFDFCPSSAVLIPELGFTYVLHIWEDPLANDTDGSISSLTQIVGPEKNSSLVGSVSPGTDYVISYIATDDDNLKAVCAFTLTSEIPACPPIVHITNGVIVCSSNNFRDSQCNITCDTGYYLNTTISSVTCQENGTWTYDLEMSQCVTVRCSDDPIGYGNFTNMQFVCEQNADAFDVVCWAVCLSGYTLRNDAAEDDIIANLQAALDNAIANHNTSSIEAQNARDAAEQAVIDLGVATELVADSQNSTTEAGDLLQQENQTLIPLELQLNELLANLSIAEHNLTEAVDNNAPNVAELQAHVAALTADVATHNETVEAQRIVVYNLTSDFDDATAALDAANQSLIDAELAVNVTEVDAIAKEALEQLALDAVSAATAAYNDALLHSTTENKVITSYARCLPNGTWDIPGAPYCTDITQPEINCIPMVIAYLNKDETSKAVTWDVPDATDNSGSVSVVRISGVEPGTTLSAGQYQVIYQAIDGDENRSPFCNLQINVEEYSCGNVTSLVNDTNMNYVCDGYDYGNTCNVSCDFGYDLEGQSSFTCEINSTSGEVTTFWDWEYPSCNEAVCSLPDAPTNGQMDCTDYVEGDNSTTGNGTATGNSTDSSVLGITCTVICDTGYILPYQTAYVYTCENGTGWSSEDFPALCIASGAEQEAIYSLQLDYDVSDTCATEDTTGFETDWVAILEQEVMSYPACTLGYTCTLGLMNSNCTNDVVTVEFSIVVTCDEDQNDGSCDLSVDLMSSLVNSINISVQGGVLNGLGVALTNDWLAAISSDLPQCADGSVLVGRYCEQCAPGSFYVGSMDSCLNCGYGSYNHLAGRKSCITCPSQTNTQIQGAASLAECLDECPPGSYSPDGMIPCVLCETGFYQDEWGTMTCKSCPPDTWTTIPGTNSSVDCVAYDIFFVDVEPTFLLTTVGERMSVVFWIQNQQQPDVTLGVYYSETDPTDYAFALKTEADAQLLFNGWDNEPTGIEIEPGVWVMIGITWDWTTKQLLIYKNGISAYDTTLNSAVALPDKLMMSSNAGTVLAGLSITNTIVSADEMLENSMDCARQLTGAVFTMDSLASLRKYNMKYIPTICAEINSTTIDHCDFNACENGAACVHNDTAGYTCNCTEEYGGPFCEELLVHGGWSSWIFSTACSVTCGTGMQDRYRLCNNPTRSNYGNDCDGNKTETVECSLDPCQECGPPGSEGGATCTLQNDTCSPICPDGYILPHGQSDQEYTCGYITNYEWIPTTDLPICSEIQSPSEYSCSLTFQLNRDIDCSIADGLAAAFELITDGLHCIINNQQCSISVSFTGCVESRRRRQTAQNSRLVVLITVPIISTDPLNFTSFYVDNNVGQSVQEIIDALTDVETTVTDLQDNPAVLTVNYVDGNLYTVVVNDPATDIVIVTSVRCDSGQVPTSGVCAECQKGTYQVGEYCVYCERGTYQSDPSQTSCESCPSGYTTVNIGARESTDCYKIPVPPVPPDYTILIAVLISVIMVILLVLVIVYFSRRFYLNAKYRAKYDMEADQISLYTDFPDIAYNVYFKRRLVLGFDEDGFPIISKEPVKNGDIAQYSDAEDEEEDHRTPTPLPKREPFAYPTEYLDPPFAYDPYKNLDTEILFPEDEDHFFDFPVMKKSVRYKVPGRHHLQNAYPLQQFGVTGKVKSRHRKPTPNPIKIPINKKLPQLMYRPPKEVTIDQIIKDQKKEQRLKREKEHAAMAKSPRDEFEEEFDITPRPHDKKAPPTLKLHKAKESLSSAIESRSPRGKTASPRSPRFKVKKPGSRGSQRSKSAAKPSKRYQSILEMTSPRPDTSASNRSLKSEPRPATSASNRSLKSALSTRAKSAPYDSPRSVNINLPSPRDHEKEVDDSLPHPPPSRYIVPKVNTKTTPKSLLKHTSVFETGNEGRPATGRKSVIFQEEGVLTRPSTSATRVEDSAPSSASKSARDTIIAPGSSRHKPPYRPYDSEVVETYRPESQVFRPESPLYRPVSSSTRASSPTFHPKPVLHGGVTVQRRQDFIMFNPPTNLNFSKAATAPAEHQMKFMKPPPFLNRVRPKQKRRASPRASQMSVRFEDSDEDESIGSSFFLTELPESPIPSRASQASRASSHAPPPRPRRASKVRFKKESPPPAYHDASHDPVIETAREDDE